MKSSSCSSFVLDRLLGAWCLPSSGLTKVLPGKRALIHYQLCLSSPAVALVALMDQEIGDVLGSRFTRLSGMANTWKRPFSPRKLANRNVVSCRLTSVEIANQT